MKPVALLFLFASLTVGHVIPEPKTSLVSRNGEEGQELKNLDDEPEFEDPVTGTKTPKSRILTGVGPDEANNRWFDWDESCSDKGQRQKILTTFFNTLELSEWTSKHLDQLERGLPKPVGPTPNKENQRYIFQQDPAYAQMFRGEDNRIDYVKKTFDLVKDNVKIPADARGGNKPGALRFICNADNKVMNNDESKPYCDGDDGPSHAIATIPYDGKEVNRNIEAKYSFEKSSSITFCPVFFKEDAFPNIDAVIGFGDHTLDKVECAERVLLHEYLHLPWIRDMPGRPDHIGYVKAADFAHKAGWRSVRVNPDNYAWLALYSYFNNNNEGCGNDVWPEGEPKPNKKP